MALSVIKIQETMSLNFLISPPQCRQNTSILDFGNSSIWTFLKLPNSIIGFMVPDILTYLILIFFCHTDILLYFCRYQNGRLQTYETIYLKGYNYPQLKLLERCKKLIKYVNY